MSNLKMFVLLFLVIFVLIFTIQNVKIVEIQLLVWQFAIPRSFLIFIMLIIGFLIGRFSRTSKKFEQPKNLDQ